MRRRIAAAAILAVGLMLGTAACTFSAPQATLIHYDPSDGVSLNVGSIQVRNAFVVSPDGEAASFVGTLINTSDSEKDVKLQYVSHVDNNTARATVDVDLTPGQVLSFGDPKVPQLVFNAIDVRPGALLTVFVQYGSVSGKNVKLPVLDGSETAYRHLVPTPVPTPPIACGDVTPSPTDIPSATDTPSPTSTPAADCPSPDATAPASTN